MGKRNGSSPQHFVVVTKKTLLKLYKVSTYSRNPTFSSDSPSAPISPAMQPNVLFRNNSNAYLYMLLHVTLTTVFSRQTTSQFYNEYKKRLQKLNLSIAPNITAYTYDALWTVAVTLNKSIPVLETMGLKLQDFYHNKTEMTELFVKTIQDIHFWGVTVGECLLIERIFIHL